MRLGERPVRTMEVIPTGSIALDVALGIGGLPRGRVVEIYGPESSGKTTVALHAIANAQAAGGIAAFIDAEHALDPDYAKALGVDTDALLVSQPDTGEQALEIADMLVRSGALDIIVIDSVAALVPRAEIEGEMGDSHVGLQARLMSQALRKITGALSNSGTTAIFINQLREKIGVMFGVPETTTGGKALKFYASVRLDVRRIESLKDGTDAVGNRTKVKVVKNKVAPAVQAGRVRHHLRPGHPPRGLADRRGRRAGHRPQGRRLVHLRGRPARPGQGERPQLPARRTPTSPPRSRRRSRRSSASARARPTRAGRSHRPGRLLTVRATRRADGGSGRLRPVPVRRRLRRAGLGGRPESRGPDVAIRPARARRCCHPIGAGAGESAGQSHGRRSGAGAGDLPAAARRARRAPGPSWRPRCASAASRTRSARACSTGYDEVGMVDDAAFARAWVTQPSPGRGPGAAGRSRTRAAPQGRRRRGVDAALHELDGDTEAATARDLVERRLRSAVRAAPDAAFRRLVGMLARKGYPAGLAIRVVKDALAAREQTASFADEVDTEPPLTGSADRRTAHRLTDLVTSLVVPIPGVTCRLIVASCETSDRVGWHCPGDPDARRHDVAARAAIMVLDRSGIDA